MASPTVYSSESLSSGILALNFSSTAMATSTMDSESTSRSSTKLFSGVTSSGLTSATSWRMAASSSRMLSATVADSFRSVDAARASGAGTLRGEHDLAGVGQAGPEAEDQHGRAGGDLAGLDHPGQRERDRRGRRVAGGHDVPGDDRVGQPDAAGQRVD